MGCKVQFGVMRQVEGRPSLNKEQRPVYREAARTPSSDRHSSKKGGSGCRGIPAGRGMARAPLRIRQGE